MLTLVLSSYLLRPAKPTEEVSKRDPVIMIGIYYCICVCGVCVWGACYVCCVVPNALKFSNTERYATISGAIKRE